MSEVACITDNDLTFLEEEFCHEYVANGGNGLQAAKAAGYRGGDMACGVNANRLLKRAHVQAYLSQLRAQHRAERDARLREKHLGRDQILYELAVLAGFDLGEFMTNGKVDLNKVKGEATKAVASIKRNKYGTELKVHDKLAALRLLMQHMGMISEQPVVNVTVDFGARMEQRRLRVIEGTATKED